MASVPEFVLVRRIYQRMVALSLRQKAAPDH